VTTCLHVAAQAPWPAAVTRLALYASHRLQLLGHPSGERPWPDSIDRPHKPLRAAGLLRLIPRAGQAVALAPTSDGPRIAQRVASRDMEN